MKKINLILLLVLIVGTTIFAQKPFEPFNPMNEKWQKELVERSTLIIEGKIIKGKNQLLDNNSKRSGKMYYLCIIKPTAVLKGNTDSTKIYQFLFEDGEYTFDFNSETGQYGPGLLLNPYENTLTVPSCGIFFLNENPTPVANTFRQIVAGGSGKVIPFDLYSLSPNAKIVGFNYGLNYGLNNYLVFPKDQVLKYLQDKFGLVAVPLK